MGQPSAVIVWCVFSLIGQGAVVVLVRLSFAPFLPLLLVKVVHAFIRLVELILVSSCKRLRLVSSYVLRVFRLYGFEYVFSGYPNPFYGVFAVFNDGRLLEMLSLEKKNISCKARNE